MCDVAPDVQGGWYILRILNLLRLERVLRVWDVFESGGGMRLAYGLMGWERRDRGVFDGLG